jgi:hypothetical protein
VEWEISEEGGLLLKRPNRGKRPDDE